MQVFDGLKITYDNKNIEGVIGDTEKVDIVFEEAVEKGETAIKVNQLKQQLLKLNLIY